MALLIYFALLEISGIVSATFIPGIPYEFYNLRAGKVLGVSYDFQDDFQSPLFGGCDYENRSDVEIHRTAFFIEKNPLNSNFYHVIEARQHHQLRCGDFHSLEKHGEFFNVLAYQDGHHIEDDTTNWVFIQNGDTYDEYQVMLGGYDFVMMAPGRSYPMANPVFAHKRRPFTEPFEAVWRVYESVLPYSRRSRNYQWHTHVWHTWSNG